MTLDVTVVIPTYNRARDLPETLHALAEQSLKPKTVIVVDNSSTDQTELLIESWSGTLARAGIMLTYLRKDPEGPASARNVGWRTATTEYVAFIDSDVSLDRDWIEITHSVFDKAPRIGAVGGKILYDHSRERLNCFGGAMSPIGLAWDAHEGEVAEAVTEKRMVLWANCSALMVRKFALQETGGFNDDFFYGFEDSDLGWRLNLFGWQVQVVPEAIAFHRVGRSIGRAAPVITYHACKNRLRSMLINWSARYLAYYGTVYLLYALTDLTLRAPRGPKAGALWWNIRHLPSTISLRRRVQSNRCVTDAEICKLVSTQWFPKQRLRGLRRRPAEQVVPEPVEADDRV